MSTDDYIDIYKSYLERFEDLFGSLDFAEVVQHSGRLIRKLKYEEFVIKWKEFRQTEDYLREVMSKGATLNDEINQTYTDLAAHVLQNPKDFMMM
jgi:hypothetical protein